MILYKTDMNYAFQNLLFHLWDPVDHPDLEAPGKSNHEQCWLIVSKQTYNLRPAIFTSLKVLMNE